MKTHKTAQRRFHITGTGKILRMKGGRSHLRRRKPPRVKALYDAKLPVHRSQIKRLKRVLPYGVG